MRGRLPPPQLHVVLLDGIAFGGFNAVGLPHLVGAAVRTGESGRRA